MSKEKQQIQLLEELLALMKKHGTQSEQVEAFIKESRQNRREGFFELASTLTKFRQFGLRETVEDAM